MNGTVQIPMKYRHWSQKSPNLNGRTRTRSQFLRITQAVCMTTPLCCLLFSFCHFGYCVGTELLLLSNLCISPGCSNKQHPNEQIFFFFFFAHKSVVSHGSAWLCCMYLLFQDPGPQRSPMWAMLFSLQRTEIQKVELSLAVVFIAAACTCIFHIYLYSIGQRVTWPFLKLWWEVTGKVRVYNPLRTITNSWGENYNLPQWSGG